MSALLFSRRKLTELLQNHESDMDNEINGLEEYVLLNTSTEDLCVCFEEKYASNRSLSRNRTLNRNLKKRGSITDPRFYFGGWARGSAWRLHIPFEGDARLFDQRSSWSSSFIPKGKVDHANRRIQLHFELLEIDYEHFNEKLESQLQNLRKWIGWNNDEVKTFNGNIRDKAQDRITRRRNSVLKIMNLADSIPFAMARRADAPSTYVVPLTQRRIMPVLPSVSNEEFEPEPTLEDEQYENILGVISSMTLVMERSPKAFRNMHEEDLRSHYLVQLNGQYEGQATGETFNCQGKTDILIRSGDKNIFVAERKFWTGPSDFEAAIDQLLGYTCWRDTKTALIIFNRDTQMSTVLSKIPDVAKNHSNFKRALDYDHVSGFRYCLGHNGDMNRELTLTVLVFDIPQSA